MHIILYLYADIPCRFEALESDPNWSSRADLADADMTGHASWVRAYDESDDLYRWFLQFTTAGTGSE